MTEEVRFLREDIMSGQLSDIALDDWSYDETLNRPGSLKAKIALTAADATEEILDPYRTAIYAVRGTNVESGGILEPPSLSIGSNSLDLSCFGWLGYWDRRIIRNTIGQPEAGGQALFKPNQDVTTTDVFGTPNFTTKLYANVAGTYNPANRIVAGGSPGDTPRYQANFNVPANAMQIHPIARVTLAVYAQALTGPRVLRLRLRIGGTDYDSATIFGTTAAGGIHKQSWTTNPATGLAWTPADVQAFASSSSAGFWTDPNALGFDTQFLQLYMTVDYAAGFTEFFTQTDQFEIFRALVLDAQSQQKFGAGWDLGIDVTWDQLSGVRRDRVATYRPFLAKNLGDALRQLAAVDNGFDFAMQYTLNTDTDRIDKAIKLYYPTKGRDTGHLFEYTRDAQTNIVARGFADPVDFAWSGDGWGTGQDETRLKSSYVDDTLRGLYPPFDAAPNWSSVSEQSTLDDHTVKTFARTKQPRRLPVVRVDPDRHPLWGDYEIGDTANFRIDDGYGSTGLIPQRNRITGTKVTSAGTYDLVLADPLGSADTSVGDA